MPNTAMPLAAQDHPELGADPLTSRLAQAFNSARLSYRGVEQDETDVDLLYRIKSNPDSYISASGSWPRPYTRGAAKEFAKVLETNLLSVIVELEVEESSGEDSAGTSNPKSRKVPIGMLSLRSVYGSDITQCRMAELGVDLLAEYQGHGYGSEAMRWILDWAFEMAGLHRVRLQCFSWNTKAILAYEAVGFKRNGVEPEAVWCAGKWWDLLTYGLLDRDWESRKAQ